MTPEVTPLESLAPHEETRLTAQVFTPKEAQALLRLSKNTINSLLNTGQLRAVRCGRKWLIPREAIAEFLQTKRLT